MAQIGTAAGPVKFKQHCHMMTYFMTQSLRLEDNIGQLEGTVNAWQKLCTVKESPKSSSDVNDIDAFGLIKSPIVSDSRRQFCALSSPPPPVHCREGLHFTANVEK